MTELLSTNSFVVATTSTTTASLDSRGDHRRFLQNCEPNVIEFAGIILSPQIGQNLQPVQPLVDAGESSVIILEVQSIVEVIERTDYIMQGIEIVIVAQYLSHSSFVHADMIERSQCRRGHVWIVSNTEQRLQAPPLSVNSEFQPKRWTDHSCGISRHVDFQHQTTTETERMKRSKVLSKSSRVS